ncbi:hypothetical protein C8R44DRAFT_734661 [Mycena epipterygia]|nr:hypothetical protein C8R44DRAFT_734661 [Mycena epipterygia]
MERKKLGVSGKGESGRERAGKISNTSRMKDSNGQEVEEFVGEGREGGEREGECRTSLKKNSGNRGSARGRKSRNPQDFGERGRERGRCCGKVRESDGQGWKKGRWEKALRAGEGTDVEIMRERKDVEIAKGRRRCRQGRKGEMSILGCKAGRDVEIIMERKDPESCDNERIRWGKGRVHCEAGRDVEIAKEGKMPANEEGRPQYYGGKDRERSCCEAGRDVEIIMEEKDVGIVEEGKTPTSEEGREANLQRTERVRLYGRERGRTLEGRGKFR